MKIKLYTDGSILKTKPPAKVDNVASQGYIAVTRNATSGEDSELGRSVEVFHNTTITEMEISAIMSGIRFAICASAAAPKDLAIEVYSDSKTAVDAFNDYIPKWVKNAIRTQGVWHASNGKPVAHQDLYKEILEVIKPYKVKFIHVKAHKESVFNNEVDAMVRDAAEQLLAEVMREAA
jgi:ribonuclease HI